MIRKLRPFILLAALWFAGDRAFAFIIGAALDRSHEPIAQLYGGRAAADIVVLGNSRAYRNLDTAAIAKGFHGSVTVLATPGASMEIENALFEDYVDRYGAPGVLVVELSALFSDPDALKSLRMYDGRSARIARLVQGHFPTLYYGGAVSRLFAYNNEATLNALHKIVYPMPDLLLDGTYEGAATYPPGRYFAPRDENVAAARKLMDTARRCAIDVRLVLSPVVPGYAAANRIDALRAATRGIAGGARVWDLADDPPTGLNLFVDPSHLNRGGVRSFMQRLTDEGFFAPAPGAERKRPCPAGGGR